MSGEPVSVCVGLRVARIAGAWGTLASPFGAPAERRWSLSALSLASVAMTFLEPDPDAEWGDRQLTHLYQAVDEWAARDG
ncbi:hypothetical protein KZ829_15375 [Actinoplanes hulinensis]|uniref:MftR C-terminal domain-containing protein n=1 Tax=Actinoplanes hulinensis TaxID=1144547 RepID=A0ABS7B258_9ACTN|nr:hypothetical protein [Actinoplanes hulinensis]MBW6435121.1 hypothetical protein [Actinoplanes hulinensis]